MTHFTIVLPTGHQCFTTDSRFIEGANLRTSARTAEAARLAVFTLAGEADAEIVKALRWAASMIFYILRSRKSTPPAAPAARTGREIHTENQRSQIAMMQRTGATTPNQAHAILMAEWVAKHPNPTTKPAPEPHRFAPVVSVDELLAKPARHILTVEDRKRAGYTTASKPAPAGKHCPHCGKSSDKYTSLLSWAGHIGFCSFAKKYAGGDLRVAGDLLSRKGLAVIDPMPYNGAWQRGANLAAA